jgi:hypothetical protein
MNPTNTLRNALSFLEKSASDEKLAEALQVASGGAGAQGFVDRLQKVAGVSADEVAAARNEDKGQEAIIQMALALLAQNKQKPGSYVIGGTQHDLGGASAGSMPEPTEGKMAEDFSHLFSNVVDHVKTAAEKAEKAAKEEQANSKVACIGGDLCGAGCDLCGGSGEMKYAEAEAKAQEILKEARDLSGAALTKYASDGVQEAAPGLNSMDHEALLAGIAQAQTAIDNSFAPMVFDNPKNGVPDFGGSTMESNPLLMLMKPNLSHGFHKA